MEMDAASRTGVDDIREIIDSVAYRAASARYKIYIIDEVHMLSRNAFNALLKTLEEPPAHVKFIFATTEIRKVPVTVLSRCQRFDLRRIEPEVMMAHLRKVAGTEGARIADDALALITRAAEGSVRDAMSLLDQAISHGAGETTVEQVRAMLGLADRGRVLDLFDLVMQGDAAGALSELSAQYADGADPLAVLRDLAEVTHWISVIKITPETADDPTVSPDERTRGRDMAARLPMRALTRMWQMLLKALEETAAAPNTMMAAEMADHPAHSCGRPARAGGPRAQALRDAGAAAAVGRGRGRPAPSGGLTSARVRPPARVTSSGGVTALAVQTDSALARYATFGQVVDLIRATRDVQLLIEVETGLRLARYEPGRIEFEPAPGATPGLAQKLGSRLQQWTGVRWAVTVVNEGGQAHHRRDAGRRALDARGAGAGRIPLVKAVLEAFPTARIADIRVPEVREAEAAQAALPEVMDEWDPFEEE
jgi:DNA polymerase III subunit gamma/tau